MQKNVHRKHCIPNYSNILADNHKSNGEQTEATANRLYKGAHIPSRVFKILDESGRKFFPFNGDGA